MTVEALECRCLITLTEVRVVHNSEELIRRIVCPHGNETDILTKAGEYDLSVQTVSKGTIESRLDMPV